MATVQDIYNELFTGKTLKIRVADDKQFNNLRIALIKKHRINKALEISEESVIARFDRESLAATFKLGEPTAGTELNQWEIISDSGESDAPV